MTAIRSLTSEIISNCRQKLSEQPELLEHPTNFLEAMLACQKKEEKNVTEHEIFGNILTMLLAGEDTTTNTLSWIMVFMTEYPEVQQKIQEESDQILGSAKTVEHRDFSIPPTTSIIALTRQCTLQENTFKSAREFQPER